MTIAAPQKYPGLAKREFILPTLTEVTAPRPLELIGSAARTAPAAAPEVTAVLAPLALTEFATPTADTDANSSDDFTHARTGAPVPESEPVHPPMTGAELDDAFAEIEAGLAGDASKPLPLTEDETAAALVLESFAPAFAAADAAADDDYRKFSLIEPDRRWVMYVAIFFLAGILIASLVSSFTSVYAMASWVGLPAFVQWLPVVILDVAIVGFSWALMVFSRRGDRSWSTRLLIIGVTAFSIAANFMHTYDHWDGDLSTPQAIMGITFSSSIPIIALFATEELIRLVFKRAEIAAQKRANR